MRTTNIHMYTNTLTHTDTLTHTTFDVKKQTANATSILYKNNIHSINIRATLHCCYGYKNMCY
jgi:hypothetical protein